MGVASIARKDPDGRLGTRGVGVVTMAGAGPGMVFGSGHSKSEFAPWAGLPQRGQISEAMKA
jgi:hypothetical protein